VSSAVARRYAAGAFALAQEEQDVEAWRAEVAKLDALFADAVLQAAFHNPAVSTVRRVELARRLASDLRPSTQNLMRLLIEHRRTREVHAIREEFERLADQATGILDATLTTAIPLGDAEQERLRGALARKLGHEVRLHAEVDAGLIGGARIRIGDHLVDGSIRAKLDQLRRTLHG
jgi:F-type H+-transporting ATPase subunit delta